jgi:hypothetical protein
LKRCIRSDIGSPKRPDQVPRGGTGVAAFVGDALSGSGDGSEAGIIGPAAGFGRQPARQSARYR